jgi:hypothetical protein
MLDLQGRPFLAHILEQVLAQDPGREIVVVTGFAAPVVEDWLESHYPGRVKTVRNPRFEEDGNILSLHLGAGALSRPELGYLAVETDLAMEPAAWRMALDPALDDSSFWLVRGRFSPDLTGGIARTREGSDEIERLAYVPVFSPEYAGWRKLVGVMGVGPREVEQDRARRSAALARTIAQYYLMPWVECAQLPPCRVVDLGDLRASSFNTAAELERTRASFADPSRGSGVLIERAEVAQLRHIEGFSWKRVQWLCTKIQQEGVWTRPLALDLHHNLVLDGQHRLESARLLGLKWVPVVRYDYATVEVWSLRPNHHVDWETVTRRALAGDTYPYKTVKHRFPVDLPACSIPLAELRK